MNTLAELKNLPFSKMEQQDYVHQAIAEILDGNIDPLAADLRLKAMEEVITKIRKDDRVKRAVVEEAEKYGKTFDLQGVNITVTNRTTRDYSGVDSTLDALYSDMEKLKATIKAREATVLAGVDPATGETFNPPKTSTSTSLTYKFK